MSGLVHDEFSSEPLSAHPVLRSTSLEETRHQLRRIFGVREVSASARRPLRARINHVANGKVSFNYVAFGAELDADVGTPEFHAVLVPLGGQYEVSYGGDRVATLRGEIACVSPRQPMRARFSAECRHLSVNVAAGVLENHLAQHLGYQPDGKIEFAAPIAVGSPAGRHLVALVKLLFRQLDEIGRSAPIAVSELSEVLLTSLLYAQPSNYRHLLFRPAHRVTPASLRKIEAFIHDNAHEPLSVERLAEVAGLSPRALFTSFKAHYQLSPMAYARRIRLERVRSELLESPPYGGIVTEVATKWGFFHLGHFSAAYKRTFGESPSLTVRRKA